MRVKPGYFKTGILLLMFCVFIGIGGFASESSRDEEPRRLANVTIASNAVYMQPNVNHAGLELSVSCPDGKVITKRFDSGSLATVWLSELDNQFMDGYYTYELRANFASGNKIRSMDSESLSTSKMEGRALFREPMVQSGGFMVSGGAIVVPGLSEGGPAMREQQLKIQDQVILDDLIVTGSICAGFDCINGESFGFDTLVLKENNLRIFFRDTSNSASFPTNDWRITVNDSSNGGASFFGIDDADSGKRPFTIEAGTRANAIYVDDSGRVGLGISTPSEDLHIWYGDTPTVRLHQSGSGWAPQTWDVAGNEANFFIRDVTNGSKLSLRIQPGAPTDTLYLASTGKVGLGTNSPGYKVHAVTSSSENCAIVCERSGYVTNFMNATQDAGNFGTVTDHPVRILTNTTWTMQINSDDTLEMADGGGYDGTWNPASSRELKENIQSLTISEARKALTELNPVKYNYKKNKEESRVGFIAEDVPELVAMKGRKNLGTVDIIAVLTKVLQEQQKTIQELKKEIKELKKNK
jgi:hypothetical protein